MNIKSMLMASVLLAIPNLYANNLSHLIQAPLRMNQCAIEETGQRLDFALTNDGYFVVSPQKKKNNPLSFTRYGETMTDGDGYLRTVDGDYMLAINKKSDATRLSKIKISPLTLPPKATNQAHFIVNLPAAANNSKTFYASTTLYDSVAKNHILTTHFVKAGHKQWSVQIYVDKIQSGIGHLTFNNAGRLTKQEGFTNILWPTDYGLSELKITFDDSTQYATPFSTTSVQHNGYLPGSLAGVVVSYSGEISLFYSNGVFQTQKSRIAVAKFANPEKLTQLSEHVYQANEKSGEPRLHWSNGDHAVLQGYLEKDRCLS